MSDVPTQDTSDVVPNYTTGDISETSVLELNYDPNAGDQLYHEVENVRLTDRLQDLSDTYQSLLGDRNEYQWKWLYKIFDFMTLSCVPDEHHGTVREVKTIMAMYNALLDDLAEEYDDPDTFWELAKVTYPGTDPNWERCDINQDYATVVHEVWQAIDQQLQQAPRYAEFIEQLRFGLRQALNSMDHSRLSISHSKMSNLTETWVYGPHNMMTHTFIDTDLMFSPSFSKDDYADVREVSYTIQEMWRIGNWVGTWEREVREHDYSAGIVVYALEEDVISQELLKRFESGDVEPEHIIGRIKAAGIEETFLADWQQRRDKLRSQDYGTETVDIDDFIRNADTLMKYHLAAHGRMKEGD